MRRRRLSTVRRRPRDSVVRILKVDLILVAVLLAIGLCYYLHTHPVRLGADTPPVVFGAEPTSATQADVLLLLPGTSPLQTGDSIDELDFAANWCNTLSQEFGVYQTASIATFRPALLERSALVVVPRSVARLMTAGQIATLEQFVQVGGRLLVELPTTAWRPLVGVVGEASQYRPTRRITAFDGAVVRGDLRDDVIGTPLATILSPVAAADVAALDGAETLMEVDGLPGIVRRRVGQGEIYALHFDVGRAVAVIQQGLPAADWEIARPSVPLPEGFTRTAAAVSDGRLRRSSVPAADQLERQLLNLLTESRPLPRLWTFPDQRPAALIMTHSGLHDWQRGRFMSDWEVEAGVTATVFARADQIEGLPSELQQGAGLLLIPAELSSAPTRQIGLLGFAPFERPLSLESQVDAARHALPDRLLVSRLTGGLWDPDYGHTFRVLAGLGVEVDSSYGPAFSATDIEAAAGYAFGTGLPFRPLDRNSLPLPLLEIPVVLHDGHALDADWALRLLERAGRVYNQLVVADWRSGTMTMQPRADVVMTWRALFEQARERDYWITDLVTFARFWQMRSSVRLRSEFSRSERRLSIWAEVPSLLAQGDAMLAPAIAFEATFEGRPVERIRRNGEDVPFVELSRSGDRVHHIFPLPQGTNRIEIAYQGPIAIDD